jgi:transcriptional regulator with XRE-family HTH domain
MRLQDFLAAENISLAAFGRSIGVPNRQTISRYVRSERFPPPDVLVRIEEVTGGRVTASDLARQCVEQTEAA